MSNKLSKQVPDPYNGSPLAKKGVKIQTGGKRGIIFPKCYIDIPYNEKIKTKRNWWNCRQSPRDLKGTDGLIHRQDKHIIFMI